MISDDDRREVAARLRELPSDVYASRKEWEEGGLFIDASIGDEADYSQIHNAVFGCFPAEHMHPGDYEELHERLADLIDRPTCKRVQMDATGRPPFYTGGIALNYVVGGCSECGYPFGNGNAIIGNPFSAPNYCPNCGARVVTDDD